MSAREDLEESKFNQGKGFQLVVEMDLDYIHHQKKVAF